MRITSRAIAIFLNYTDLQRTLYAFIAAETILLHLLHVAECLIAKNGVLIEGKSRDIYKSSWLMQFPYGLTKNGSLLGVQ